MNTSLISIIVPVYNAERYLAKCIKSALQQTYKNIELILLNDGSKDQSGAICQHYADIDSRVVYIKKENSGVSDTRNTGLALAKGEYIFFLDSDDYLDCKSLEMLYKSSRDGKLAMIGYCLDLTDENRFETPSQTYGSYDNMRDYYLDFHKYYATKFNFVWGKLYDAKIIHHYNLKFSEDILLGEDLLFNLDYYGYCDSGIESIPFNGYYYRQHGGGTLSKKFDSRMFKWNEVCFKAILNFLKNHDCFTPENQTHLFRNIVGNYQYGFYLIALNKQFSMTEKVALIKQYVSTTIYQESLIVEKSQRIDYRIFNWLLHHGMIRSYILLENLKKRIFHGHN